MLGSDGVGALVCGAADCAGSLPVSATASAIAVTSATSAAMRPASGR